MRRGSAAARGVFEEQDYYARVVRQLREKEIREAHELRTKHNWHTSAARLASYDACMWCGREYGAGPDTRTREHIVPRYFGGSDEPQNIGWSHLACNRRRGHSERAIPYQVHQKLGEMVWLGEEE